MAKKLSMKISAKIACARHILVKTKTEAEHLKTRLANGEDFGKLARKFSLCASAKRGGDLGEFRRGQMVRAVDQVVFNKAILIVHGPVKTKFGYHLIQTIYRN